MLIQFYLLNTKSLQFGILSLWTPVLFGKELTAEDFYTLHCLTFLSPPLFVSLFCPKRELHVLLFTNQLFLFPEVGEGQLEGRSGTLRYTTVPASDG